MKTQLLTLRNAELTDEQNVVALWRSCDLVASYNDPVADYRFALRGDSSTVLVAEDEQKAIIGAVMVGHDGHRGWLYYVAAAPALRSRGIGRAMVEAGEDWLRARDVVKVQLIVRPTNTAVIGFYEHLGFEDMPRILMGKWLKTPS